MKLSWIVLILPSFALAQPDKAVDRQLAKSAKRILTQYCYRCHGKDGVNEGGFNYSLDLSRMIRRRKVVPGDPAKSRIFKRLTRTDDPMPPPEVKMRPTAKEIAVIKAWIEGGATAFDPPMAQFTRITPQRMIQFIHTDLKQVEKRARPYSRYFTLTHLYNARVSTDELLSYRHGLSKLINSLSWGKRVVKPKPIDPAKTIFRIDLRDYQWDAKVWSSIVDRNPYCVQYRFPTARACNEMTKSRLPFIRADWFVATAARPPLYHSILQLPESDLELEKMLRVDVAKNIRQERIARAGFNGSGVSRNNRMIERHEQGFGAYWKSYDFGGNSGRKNLFAHPMGPGEKAPSFQHDGGEIIFNLPNGLQAYMLVDQAGKRIDKGPTSIVSDPRRGDRAVENGISCMSCHARGIIRKQDQIRPHVVKNPDAFPKEIAGSILAVYPKAAEMEKLYAEDAKRFQEAVTLTGAPLSTTEPVVALALRFESELDLELVAAESGVTPKELQAALGRSADLARRLGALRTKAGTVQREVLVSVFPTLMMELKAGEVLSTKDLEYARLIITARTLSRERQPAMALQAANKAIELRSGESSGYLERASAHHDLMQYREAIADYTQAIKLQPKLAIPYNNRGLVYFDQKDFQRAIADYTTAIDLDPGYVVALRNRGIAYQQQERLRLAIQDFSKAIGLDPGYVPALRSRAAAYYQRNDHGRAIRDFDMALSLVPDSPITLHNRGMAHLAMARFSKAMADFNAAIKLKPRYGLAYYGRALVHMQQESSDKAMADLNRSIQLSPSRAQSYFLRARLHQRQGNVKKAKADLAQARKLSQGDR